VKSSASLTSVLRLFRTPGDVHPEKKPGHARHDTKSQ
jgi:hypothetical protein